MIQEKITRYNIDLFKYFFTNSNNITLIRIKLRKIHEKAKNASLNLP